MKADEISYLKTKTCYFIIDKERRHVNKESLCELIVKLISIKHIDSFIFHSYGYLEKYIINKIRRAQLIMGENFKIYLNTFNEKQVRKYKKIFDDVMLLDRQKQPLKVCNEALKNIGAFLGEICIFIINNPDNNIHLEKAKENLSQYFIL